MIFVRDSHYDYPPGPTKDQAIPLHFFHENRIFLDNLIIIKIARFEVFTVVLAKILVVTDMTSYRLVNRFLCFRGAFYHHLQGVRNTRRSCISPEYEGNNLRHKVSDYQLMQHLTTQDWILIMNSSRRTLFR